MAGWSYCARTSRPCSVAPSPLSCPIGSLHLTGAPLPRPRKREHRGLPARWIYQHGAYYYIVPRGLEAQWDGKKLFRLGATSPEAYRVWAERLGELEAA